MVSGHGLWAVARVLDLAVRDVSGGAAEPAEDLEEILGLLGMVPVVEDGPVFSAVPGERPDVLSAVPGSRPGLLSEIGAALAAAPQWPAAGPAGITWPPPVSGLPGSLDAALAMRPAKAAGNSAAGMLGLRNCRALLRRAADAVQPLDAAGWTARQRMVAAVVILMALGVIVPAAGPGTSMVTDGDLARALPVILALAALIGAPLGAGFPSW